MMELKEKRRSVTSEKLGGRRVWVAMKLIRRNFPLPHQFTVQWGGTRGIWRQMTIRFMYIVFAMEYTELSFFCKKKLFSYW